MLQRFPLYTAAQVRQLDRHAIEQAGIPGYILMSRAGESAWLRLRKHWPAARSLLVLCGTGNNGGDGYVIGRLALEAGHAVLVMQLGDAAGIRGDALAAREAAAFHGKLERLEPGSGNELNGVRRMLALAQRFNFNVEEYEERIPV